MLHAGGLTQHHQEVADQRVSVRLEQLERGLGLRANGVVGLHELEDKSLEGGAAREQGRDIRGHSPN